MLAAGAGAGVKRVSLELGGNAPVLVFEDADLELAARGEGGGQAGRGGRYWGGRERQGGVARIGTEKCSEVDGRRAAAWGGGDGGRERGGEGEWEEAGGGGRREEGGGGREKRSEGCRYQPKLNRTKFRTSGAQAEALVASNNTSGRGPRRSRAAG